MGLLHKVRENTGKVFHNIKGEKEMKLINFIKKLNREESGQDLVEYALVLVAVAGAAVAGSTSLANTISAGIVKMNTTLQAYF